MDTVDVLQIKIEEAKSNLPEETLSAINAVDWRAAILKLRETKGYNFEQLGDLETETELLLCGLLSGREYPKELERRMGISKAQADDLVNEMNESVFRKIREELIKITEDKKIFGKSPAVVPVPQKAQQPIPKIAASKNDSQVLGDAGIEILERLAHRKPDNDAPHPKSWFGEEKSQVNNKDIKAGLPALEKLELKSPAPAPAPANLPVAPKPVVNIPKPDLVQAPKEVPHPLLAQKFSGYVQNKVIETQHSVDNLIQKKSVIGSSLPKPPAAPKVTSYAKGGDPYRLPPE